MKAHIVDIVNKKIFDGEIIIKDGFIEEIREVKDLPKDSPYIMPGFVDSHIHIESTMLLPEHYAEVAVKMGVVSAIADPHEIANVLGMDGIEYMINNGKKVRFGFHFGASSCVPSTCFETSGSTLNSEAVKKLLQKEEIYGLSEMMNVPGVLFKDPEVMAKIQSAIEINKPIDGHAPGTSGDNLKQYVEAGISTDHECSELADAEERIKLGMMIQIREGSAARNYDKLCPLIQEYPNSTMFCSDDKEPEDLQLGYINELVKASIKKGYSLWNVLQTACVNPVKHYKICNGLLQKGDKADFIIVNNLQDFEVQSTFIDGIEVYNKSYDCLDNLIKDKTIGTNYPNKFNAKPIKTSDLKINSTNEDIKVIVAYDGEILTDEKIFKSKVIDNNIVSDIEKDVMKMVVYNRYTEAKPAIAFINGFTLKKGALASTVAHDSHNIIAIGTSDEEIVKVINEIIRLKGGMVVSDGAKIETLPLPVAGLMSGDKCEKVAYDFEKLKKVAKECGCKFNAPFMTMAFMALPVIPKLKLTDLGLFDGVKFEFTKL